MNGTLSTLEGKDIKKDICGSADVSAGSSSKKHSISTKMENYGVDGPVPSLVEPLDVPEKIAFSYQTLEWLEGSNPAIEYDRLFNRQLHQCGEWMLKKGKILLEEWEDPSFLHAIYYEYSYPEDKRGNKKAKKLANKMIRYSLEGLDIADEVKKSLLCIHRNKIRDFIEKISNVSYEADLKHAIHGLSADEQAPVFSAACRSDLRSYFTESTKKHYYTFDKQIKEKQRKFYGTATDHQFALDMYKYDLSTAYHHKNIFLKNLNKEELPEELKAKVLFHYYQPFQEEEQKQVQKIYSKLMEQTEEEAYAHHFGNAYKDILIKGLRDHLYFRKQFFEAARRVNPPLTSNEIQDMDNVLQGKANRVPEPLQVIQKNCYLEAYEALMANDPSLSISWKMHPQMMEQACRLEKWLKSYLINEIGDCETVDEIIDCLTNRHLEAKAHYHTAKKYLESLLLKGWRESNQQCDIRLRKIRELNNHICFVDEFRRLYQPLTGSLLSDWFRKNTTMPPNAKQVLRIVLNKVKQQRGLPVKWKPNISLIVKAADSFDEMIEGNQRAYDYIEEIKHHLQEYDTDVCVMLSLFQEKAKEAVYTAVGSKMYPKDECLAHAVRCEEEAMLQLINMTEGCCRISGLPQAMMKCLPTNFTGWFDPYSAIVPDQGTHSIRTLFNAAFLRTVPNHVIDALAAITLNAISALSLNVSIGKCLKYSSHVIGHLMGKSGMRSAVCQRAMLLSLYLIAVSAAVQSITRYLLYTGGGLNSLNVEGVDFSFGAKARILQQEELKEVQSEMTEQHVLTNLLMTSIVNHQQLIVEGLAKIYKVPMKAVIKVWNPSGTLNEIFSQRSNISHTLGEAEKSDRRINEILRKWWHVINKMELFDSIGYSIAHITLIDMLANVENNNIKLNLAEISSVEYLFLELLLKAITHSSIAFSLRKEQYFSDFSLVHKLDRKIVKGAGQ